MSLPEIVIPFIKASACGNDFLLIDAANLPGGMNLKELTKQICDRHAGVGADGVEWMSPHASADIEISLINSDGSEAEISGNGTRCVAAYICATQEKEKITVQTGAGLKTCVLIARNESEYEFEADMGFAETAPQIAVRTSSGIVNGIPVSMGNPHYVVFVAEFPEDWQMQSGEIQRDPKFPQGVNIEMVVADGEHSIHVRFFERGAGETLSSGTGSSASAVAAVATGKAASPVQVHAPGGTQTVRLEGMRVFLRGSAKLVCQGEYFPS